LATPLTTTTRPQTDLPAVTPSGVRLRLKPLHPLVDAVTETWRWFLKPRSNLAKQGDHPCSPPYNLASEPRSARVLWTTRSKLPRRSYQALSSLCGAFASLFGSTKLAQVLSSTASWPTVAPTWPSIVRVHMLRC
jgi:hypothetical protein